VDFRTPDAAKQAARPRTIVGMRLIHFED